MCQEGEAKCIFFIIDKYYKGMETSNILQIYHVDPYEVAVG